MKFMFNTPLFPPPIRGNQRTFLKKVPYVRAQVSREEQPGSLYAFLSVILQPGIFPGPARQNWFWLRKTIVDNANVFLLKAIKNLKGTISLPPLKICMGVNKSTG